MKTSFFILFLLASLATAQSRPVIPARPVTRTTSGETIITSRYGNGTRTTDSQGRTWTTSRYGKGTITRGPAGSTYQTRRYGHGTITQGRGTPPPVITGKR